MTHETKPCNTCGKLKSFPEFNYIKKASGKIYYKNKCRKCDLIRRRQWDKEHPDKVRALNRKLMKRKNKIRTIKMTDTYIRGLLSRRPLHSRTTYINQNELIETKRVHLLLKRNINYGRSKVA